MNITYTDTPVPGENIVLDDCTEVSVVLRSFPSARTGEVAITLEDLWGGHSAVELTAHQARWLAATLLRAADAMKIHR